MGIGPSKQNCRDILLLQRMLGKLHHFCRLRTLVSACMAILIACASLVPLAARSLIEPDSSCCRKGMKGCCKKGMAKPVAGPLLSAKSCEADCGRVTLGGVIASGFIPPSAECSARPLEKSASLCAVEAVPAVHLSDHSLQQRPPPPSTLG